VALDIRRQLLPSAPELASASAEQLSRRRGATVEGMCTVRPARLTVGALEGRDDRPKRPHCCGRSPSRDARTPGRRSPLRRRVRDRLPQMRFAPYLGQRLRFCANGYTQGQVGDLLGPVVARRIREVWGRSAGVSKSTVEPLSARLSWEEVHRLELLMRLRASSLTKSVGSPHMCPFCDNPLGAAPMRLGGILVHPGCLSESAYH
jgi:hypothetical protein